MGTPLFLATVSAVVFLTCELTLDISKQSVMGKTGPPQIRHPISVGAGAHILFAPSGFALRFAKSCWPGSLSRFANCSREPLSTSSLGHF